jgi:hypothetical protein
MKDNKIASILITQHCEAFAQYLHPSSIINGLITFNSKRALFWRSLVTDNKTYSSLHVKCPMFLPDFNKIWNFSKDCRKSSHYDFSRICVQWEPLMYAVRRTDQQRYSILVEESSFMSIYCRLQQQYVLSSSCKVHDVFARL